MLDKDEVLIIEYDDTEPKRKGGKTKKHHKPILYILIVSVSLFALLGIYCAVMENLAYKECSVQAGVTIDPKELILYNDDSAAFWEDKGKIDFSNPGNYKVYIITKFYRHRCTIHVQDTIPPEITVRDVSIRLGEIAEAKDFIAEAKDATSMSVFYHTQPDFITPGLFDVQIDVMDLGNNLTSASAKLFISPIKEVVTTEAGSWFPSNDEFMISGHGAKILNRDDINMDKPGIYRVSVEYDGVVTESVLEVEDTVAPNIVKRDVEAPLNKEIIPDMFVESVSDASKVTFSFVTQPNLGVSGQQSVTVCAKDAYENTTEFDAMLTLVEDVTPPVIRGVRAIVAGVGSSVAYKRGVSVSDDISEEENINLQVDISSVDMNTTGTYPVIYRAVDEAGNTNTVSTTISVVENVYSEEVVMEMADSVLQSIVKPEMSQRDVAYAIILFMKNRMFFTDVSTKSGNWLQGAYDGLATRSGDCWNYACVSQALLTRAGITNRMIWNVPGAQEHYWNLVDLGDGWYHFDSVARLDGTLFFLYNDEDLMEYSSTHGRTHDYDRSLFPEVN